jgi:3-methyladenine DNA glycosylase Tag
MSLYSSQTSNLPPLYQPSRQQGANSAPPTVANNTSAVEYPEVNNLSAEEIQSLLEDEDLFRDFILKQTSVKANSKMLTELRQTNYEISQRNIANEAPQRLLREEVAELQQLVATKQSTLQQLTEEKQRLLKV